MDNVIYMVGDKSTGKFFNAKDSRYYDRITFSMFFPSKLDCETVLMNIDNSNFIMVKGEVIEFKDNELTVAYENFSESSPF